LIVVERQPGRKQARRELEYPIGWRERRDQHPVDREEGEQGNDGKRQVQAEAIEDLLALRGSHRRRRDIV